MKKTPCKQEQENILEENEELILPGLAVLPSLLPFLFPATTTGSSQGCDASGMVVCIPPGL